MARRPPLVAAALSVALSVALFGCAPEDEPRTVTRADSCAPADLALKRPGTLTVGTDSPAFPPWFEDNDPSNGRGFESAVAYAVAEELGFAREDVRWIKVPFNNSYAPGEKRFDVDINQISITPQRQEVVDFSDGYYTASQALVTLKENADVAGSLAELRELRLGAQTGTTSLTAIRETVQPAQEPLIFETNNAAKQALLNGQVDGIVTDLPTAFFITAVEIPQGTIVGQFEPATDTPEEFGLLMEKGSELLPCVNQALATLESEGTLAQLEQRWLSDVVDVPVLE